MTPRRCPVVVFAYHAPSLPLPSVSDVLEDLNVQGMRKSARGTLENPGKSVKAKSALNRKLSQTSCMGMLERFLHYKAGEVIKVPARNTSRRCAQCGHTEKDNRRTQAHFQCRACGHTDNADANAARNILGLGLNRLLAGGAPVTGRGEDNEAGAFFMECLVETANDPSTMPWNYRGSPPDFHTESGSTTWVSTAARDRAGNMDRGSSSLHIGCQACRQ